MKKLLMGLLVATLMTLTLSGKSNTKAKNKKNSAPAAPMVKDAFFSNDVDMNSFESTKEAFEINSLSLTGDPAYLVFKIDNTDKNFNEIQFSPNSNFEPKIYYSNLYEPFKDKTLFWANIGLNWSEFSFREDFVKSNGEYYLRAIDKDGNVGETFVISDVTISN